MRIVLSILLLSVLIVAGCKSRESETGLREAVGPDSTVMPTNPIGGDPYEEGFTITRRPAVYCPIDGGTFNDRTWPFAFYDADDRMAISGGFALDQGTTPEGDIVFKWPKADETIHRDYDRVAELMKEYSELVGTCLHRGATGPGEEAWLSYIRSEQFAKTGAALRESTEAFCSEVVNQLIDRYVPSGSRYRQYGNCGEGGRVGACLARRSGFKDSEIRVCLSKNDHFFGMVYRGEENGKDHKWCILDRWDLIGNFNCDVDVDDIAHEITYQGKPTGQNWFAKAKCATLEEYQKNPYGALDY